jgi:hypothetical protein
LLYARARHNHTCALNAEKLIKKAEWSDITDKEGQINDYRNDFREIYHSHKDWRARGRSTNYRQLCNHLQQILILERKLKRKFPSYIDTKDSKLVFPKHYIEIDFWKTKRDLLLRECRFFHHHRKSCWRKNKGTWTKFENAWWDYMWRENVDQHPGILPDDTCYC